jgi:GNAT superfamily N-acetyltransferase
MLIRRVREGESELLRRIRLGALAEAPYAFDSPLADERELPAEVWARRAATGAAGEAAVTFFAEDDGDYIGLVTGLWEVEGPARALIVSMWVAPRARGRGLGQRLLDTVVDWAKERGALHVDLWVTEGNDPARTLYENAGFTPTGERAPLDSDPSLIGLKLSLLVNRQHDR